MNENSQVVSNWETNLDPDKTFWTSLVDTESRSEKTALTALFLKEIKNRGRLIKMENSLNIQSKWIHCVFFVEKTFPFTVYIISLAVSESGRQESRGRIWNRSHKLLFLYKRRFWLVLRLLENISKSIVVSKQKLISKVCTFMVQRNKWKAHEKQTKVKMRQTIQIIGIINWNQG